MMATPFKGQNNKDDACRQKTGAGQDLFMNPLEIRRNRNEW